MFESDLKTVEVLLNRVQEKYHLPANLQDIVRKKLT